MLLCKHAHATTESSHEIREIKFRKCLEGIVCRSCLCSVSYLLGSFAMAKIVEAGLTRCEASSYRDIEKENETESLI